MTRSILFALVGGILTLGGCAANARDPVQSAPSCDIIFTLSHAMIPRVNLESTTLEEALNFLLLKCRGALDLDPPQTTAFKFDYRLPEDVRQRRVSFRAENITALEAMKRALGDVPIAITFEPGKVIFSPLTPDQSRH